MAHSPTADTNERQEKINGDEQRETIDIEGRDWEVEWLTEPIAEELDVPDKPKGRRETHVPYFVVGVVRDYEGKGLGRTDALYVSTDGEHVVNAEYTGCDPDWGPVWRCVWVPLEISNVGDTPESYREQAAQALGIHARLDKTDLILARSDRLETISTPQL